MHSRTAKPTNWPRCMALNKKGICMTPQEQVYKEFEAKLVAHLKAMDKAGKGNFNDWLACQQVLLQMRQTQALEGIHDIMKYWDEKGVGVNMGPFFG